MLVLHSIWDTDQFYLWAESSALPLTAQKTPLNRTEGEVPPHPFALPAQELKSHLSKDGGFNLSGESATTLALRLPSTRKGPLPSPWLLREDNLSEKATSLRAWTMPALALPPHYALDLLLDLPVSPVQGLAYADSIRFWSALALFSLELVAREQFVPAMRTGRAAWKAVLDEDDEQRLMTFLASLPLSCSGFLSERSSLPSPRALVTSFLDTLVDAQVRRGLKDVALLPPRRGRPPKDVALSQQFLKALSAGEPAPKTASQELGSFSRELDLWTAQLSPAAEEVALRTCFRLEPPSPPVESTPERASDEDTWRLHFLLQARDDRSLLVPAEDVWRSRSAALTLLKRRLKNPQEQLLADLGKAARIMPEMESALEAARPVGMDLEREEAYSFLRQTAPLLEQSGFGVILPPWWDRQSARLGVKLRLKDAPKKESTVGSGLFGLNSLVEYDWELALGDVAITKDEFMKLSRLKTPLVQMRGEWVELRPQEIEAAIKFFKEGERRNNELSLGEALRLGLNTEGSSPPGSAAVLPVVGFQAEGQIKEMLSALSDPAGGMMPAQTPEQFHGTLRPYQLRGVSWLEYLHRFGLGACLADDMGLGKTVEVIAFLLREKEISHPDLPAADPSEAPAAPALLICPMSVAGNWQSELERFSPIIRVLLHHGPSRLSGQAFREAVRKNDLVITTYALAQRDEDEFAAINWSHLILDEAQSIKNQTARQTQAIKRLKARNRIALTGTPVENRLSELWSIMDFLNPGYLGSAASFRRDFVLPVEKYKNKSRSEALRSIIRPFVLRRLKTDSSVISDLPEKLELKANYNLTPEQASLYRAVVDEMLEKIESADGMERRGQILAALTKLKQICNHPALFLQDGSSLPGRSGKLSRLEEMLYEAVAAGDRALVFTQFAGMGAMLRHHIQERLGVEVLFLHGGSTKKQRDAMIKSFQLGGAPVFVLSLKAGGFGLNLTAANHVFHFDRWWNPAVENQATDRAFRIGQRKNVFVHKFVCLGTLEERIDQMIEQKKALADSVIGAGEDWITELSNDALRDILSLRQSAVSLEGD